MSRPGRLAHAARLGTLIWIGILAALPAAGHEFRITDVLLVLRADATYQVDVRADVDALALGVSPAADDAELVEALARLEPEAFERARQRARDTVARRVKVFFDDRSARPAVSFPEEALPAAQGALPSRFGTVARLAGRRPASAETVAIGASRAFGPVQLTVLDERFLVGTRILLEPGERSAPYSLDQPPAATGAGGTRQPGTIARYVALGFEHILPLGLDHILFVLGLFLLAARLRPLLWQVSAFTAAHTLSLALSMAGVVSLPSRWVETLIAASIAYVAIENLATDRMHPWRPLLVFGFGLLHGLGFAGVLRQLGLPEGEWAVALVAFNVGVELGQLTVIGLAFLAVGWFRDRPWYRRWIVLPASAAIAIAGLFWCVERALGG